MILHNKQVTVMGLGRFGGGVGVTRFLVQQGARVLVTDLDDESHLTESLQKLQGLPITYRLGGHVEADFTDADMIVVNPAVDPRNNPFLQAARNAGVPLTSEIRLLVQRLPNRERTIGITGSAGKSTTTAMIGHALKQIMGDGRVHIGGNLGGSLLEQLEHIHPDHWVILELSSFMLEGLDEEGWSPHIAVATNLTANHLDRHGSFEAYARAKQAIFEHQNVETDIACLGSDLEPHLTPRVKHVIKLDGSGPDAGGPIDLLLPGEHNQLNARLAVLAMSAIEIPPIQSREALADFPGLPHRLQFVLERAGVRYFNDSKCTTPGAAMLAIRGFPHDTVHAILGGYDKGSDLTPMARLAVERCRAIYTIGATGDLIATAAREHAADLAAQTSAAAPVAETCGGAVGWKQPHAQIVPCGDLDSALRETATRVRQGDVVLLTPGCASYDQFDNYEHRGAAFVASVLNVTGEGAPAPLPPAP